MCSSLQLKSLLSSELKIDFKCLELDTMGSKGRNESHDLTPLLSKRNMVCFAVQGRRGLHTGFSAAFNWVQDGSPALHWWKVHWWQQWKAPAHAMDIQLFKLNNLCVNHTCAIELSDKIFWTPCQNFEEDPLRSPLLITNTKSFNVPLAKNCIPLRNDNQIAISCRVMRNYVRRENIRKKSDLGSEDTFHISKGREDTWGRSTVYPLHKKVNEDQEGY
eukprot:1158616-Pelagomonas_calceolata.AAC.1